MKRERNATAEHDPGGADAGEPEPEDEAKEEFYDTTPVKSGLAFSFGAGESPLIKAAKEIEDEEKALWEGKTGNENERVCPNMALQQPLAVARNRYGCRERGCIELGMSTVARSSAD